MGDPVICMPSPLLRKAAIPLALSVACILSPIAGIVALGVLIPALFVASAFRETDTDR
ncbi:MAG TPA: hypothetical protein VL283_03415 [Candidatus Baltobacteraceae bacterium]|nr:hypothetical protein [Candidatus Baltobacteraceae bacterium]